jgi:hypothetical protein
MKRHFFVLVLALGSVAALQADDNPYNSIGIEPTYTYKHGLVESINVYNGNLNISLPILALKGRAGLDLNVTLSYNSRQYKFWSNYEEGIDGIDYNYTGPKMGTWVANFCPFVKETITPVWNGSTWVNQGTAEVTLETGAKHDVFAPYQTYPRGWSTNSADFEYHFDSKILSTRAGARPGHQRNTS